VLLDATNAADWSCTAGSEGCVGYCRIEGGVMATHDTTLLHTPSFPAQPYCASRAGQCQWTSTRRIDFRTYTTARLQFRLTAATFPNGGATGGHVTVRAISNVPGTANLTLLDQDFNPVGDGWTQAFDVSLENSLAFSEATIEISLRYFHSVSPTLYDNPRRCEGVSEAYVRDFRVVARQ